jgi:energy-converting hydrogenase Eha subunit C
VRPTSTRFERPLETWMSFLLYMIGFIVFIAGLAWLATVAGVSQVFVTIGALVLLAIGIFTAIARIREKDPPVP